MDVHSVEREYPMTDPAALLADILHRLDTCDREVTPWEADFLESVLRQAHAGRGLSPKQLAVVRRMAEQYLSPELAAELAGQGRLL